MGGPAYAVLAEGHFEPNAAKTACCLIRYRPEQVVAVIDSRSAGRSVQEVLGFGGSIPVVATLEEALAREPERLLIGIAPAGGALPEGWREVLLAAIDAGLDVYSGLHTLLGEDPELAERAARRGVRLVDLRAVPGDLTTPSGARDAVQVPVVLTVGSDCNVGKMTTAWEIVERARSRGRRYAFVATGQTGRLLAGSGFAIDRVISDFVAGAAERLVVEAAAGSDLVLVEGQGSLTHPYYSGVTLGLLHGAQPDAMILCHVAGHTRMRHSAGLEVASLSRLVQIYEEAAAWIASARSPRRAPGRVVAISLATFRLAEPAAREALQRAAGETGLPAEDPVRFPSGALFEVCERSRPEPV
jgi:uncharacterized NAD-dependent epimerase/dehydratase family protein